jgi:NADH-quinone oxidoreductase subunit J
VNVGTAVTVALLVVAALWTVQASILLAALGLGVVSVLVTVLLFQMGAPLAGVFELSVCAGLITVLFTSIISMIRPLTADAQATRRPKRLRRFLPALGLAALAGWIAFASGHVPEGLAPAPESALGVREALWGLRRLDLAGLILMLFVGAFAVVTLFGERDPEEPEVDR